MSKENKIEKFIKPEELPDFLRKMADAIETGESEDMTYFTVIAGFKKLKINISHDAEQTVIKIKAKPEKVSATVADQNESAESNTTSKLKYSTLKKRMKSSFKIIFKSIHAGNLPPEEAAAEFIADSRLMVSYENKGENYYTEYIAACDEFVKALEEKNIENAHKACDSINNIKAHCHSQHK